MPYRIKNKRNTNHYKKELRYRFTNVIKMNYDSIRTKNKTLQERAHHNKTISKNHGVTKRQKNNF